MNSNVEIWLFFFSFQRSAGAFSRLRWRNKLRINFRRLMMSLFFVQKRKKHSKKKHTHLYISLSQPPCACVCVCVNRAVSVCCCAGTFIAVRRWWRHSSPSHLHLRCDSAVQTLMEAASLQIFSIDTSCKYKNKDNKNNNKYTKTKSQQSDFHFGS